MITPADMARMVAKAAGKRAQKREINDSGPQDNLEPDSLLYSSGPETELGQAFDGASLRRLRAALNSEDGEGKKPPQGSRQGTDQWHTTEETPTPALMARIHQGGPHTTFASLDAQELPAVREYSAGGLIFDDRNRVAVIARHSRSGHLEWCLPKGHIEKGETPEETAVREIHEETGILGVVVTSIATTDYWFTGTDERVHKLVHHFALRKVGGFLTVEGDPDHEAEDTKWVDFEDLDKVLSYPNERKIVWLYARKMNRQGQ
ncbi:NUDIX hydrolase [Bifidobacterium bombi]|uniref:Hydrolase, NUDIX family protein n=1 Tax=Bifidobacterium bombi DSM 19703 TaxID=1341695 RepID=A0A086BPK5_9BIFI|nr:NUDIX hydrolase [Bifidobacterium bombi]KFF31869.1 hydrolase, NUDIX family protein [Bifidobacterium bombi DSM 19703]